MRGFLDDLPVDGFGTRRRKKPEPEPKITTDTVVIYSVVRCPQCGGDKCPVYSNPRRYREHIIRYHKCGNCGCGFKSVEEKIRK